MNNHTQAQNLHAAGQLTEAALVGMVEAEKGSAFTRKTFVKAFDASVLRWIIAQADYFVGNFPSARTIVADIFSHEVFGSYFGGIVLQSPELIALLCNNDRETFMSFCTELISSGSPLYEPDIHWYRSSDVLDVDSLHTLVILHLEQFPDLADGYCLPGQFDPLWWEYFGGERCYQQLEVIKRRCPQLLETILRYYPAGFGLLQQGTNKVYPTDGGRIHRTCEELDTLLAKERTWLGSLHRAGEQTAFYQQLQA